MSVHLIEADALFHHIPKVGGVWIEEALPASGVRTEYAKAISTVTWRHPLLVHLTRSFRFVFTFVRHPLGWYESWWKSQASLWIKYEPGVWHPQRELECCESDDFSEFVRRCIEREPAYVTRMYEWYIGPPGFETVDFIGRYENLIDDLVQVLKMLSCEFDESVLRQHPPANISLGAAGEPIWDPELRERILALEAPTLRRFYGDQ
jgi:hypothetical protein